MPVHRMTPAQIGRAIVQESAGHPQHETWAENAREMYQQKNRAGMVSLLLQIRESNNATDDVSNDLF